MTDQERSTTSNKIFPQINPYPSFTDVLDNMNFKDYSKIGLFSIIGLGIGFLAGTHGRIVTRSIRIPSIVQNVWIWGIGGFFYGLMDSGHRLIGNKPNYYDVQRLRPDLLSKYPEDLPKS